MMLAENPGAAAAEPVENERDTPGWVPGPDASLQAIQSSAVARANAGRFIVDPPSYVFKSGRCPGGVVPRLALGRGKHDAIIGSEDKAT
jgi:hypothetical protein